MNLPRAMSGVQSMVEDGYSAGMHPHIGPNTGAAAGAGGGGAVHAGNRDGVGYANGSNPMYHQSAHGTALYGDQHGIPAGPSYMGGGDSMMSPQDQGTVSATSLQQYQQQHGSMIGHASSFNTAAGNGLHGQHSSYPMEAAQAAGLPQSGLSHSAMQGTAQPSDYKVADVGTQQGAPAAARGVSSFMVNGARFDINTAEYRLIKHLGHGAYGTVCAAERCADGERVAIKKIPKVFANATLALRTLRELRILRHFNHENIIRLLHVLPPPSYDQFEDMYIVSELMDTDLHQVIRSGQALSNEHMQYFLYQLLRGVKHLHSANVMHRDLKPSNLLVNATCDVKICDFGLARSAAPLPHAASTAFLTEYVATRWYRAPEIMLSWRQYTKAVDVWAVGCIFAELLARRPLFPGRDFMSQLHCIINVLGSPSPQDTESIASEKARNYVRTSIPYSAGTPFTQLFPQADPLALDLLRRMLTFAPEKRITVEEALAHPYFKALHDPADEPVCPALFVFDFERFCASTDAEQKDPKLIATLKALLWQEACFHNPGLHLQTPLAVTQQLLSLGAMSPHSAASAAAYAYQLKPGMPPPGQAVPFSAPVSVMSTAGAALQQYVHQHQQAKPQTFVYQQQQQQQPPGQPGGYSNTNPYPAPGAGPR